MRAFVFTDKSLASEAGRFAWLSLNTEDAKTAALRSRFPVEALPTFFVVDPLDEKVALRWVGGMTLPQLRRMLDDGTLAVNARHGEKRAPESIGTAAQMFAEADETFDRAEALYGRGDNRAAADLYLKALRMAPDNWSHYARATESLLFALQQTQRYEEGATIALNAYPRLKHTASGLNVA